MSAGSFFDLADMDDVRPKVLVQPEIDSTVWQKDVTITEAINEFEAKEPTDRDCGIKTSSLPDGMNLLQDRVAALRLVTRKEQRAVVKKAFEISRTWLATDSPKANRGKNAKQFIVALRGSPGIGKSWSSLLYLKMLLKEKRRSILFESGTSPTKRTTYLFAIEGSRWAAFKLIIKSTIPDEWLSFSDIDTLIDPAQFPSTTDPQPSALIESDGHIFIPVSPDNRHLGGTHKSSSARIELILGPWTLRELSIAWPWMLYSVKPSSKEYEEMQKLVEKRYYQFGGVPRYLLDDVKADDRASEMNPANAKRHAQLLLQALANGKIDDRKKIVTLFFTMYPGVNDLGEYDPDVKYSTVEFVSHGALRAAGQAVFEKINSDVVWRNSTDASSVGLAFEAVALMFLHTGTEGMHKLGITVHCRELLKDQRPKTAKLHLGFCPYRQKLGSTEICPVVDVNDEQEFFEVVKKSGDTLNFSSATDCVTISSNSAVSFPPPGLANVDGMSGPRLGFPATLQANHPPSGASYMKQRRALNVTTTSAICFVVPHGRFTEGWSTYQNFRWKGGETPEDGEKPSNKRRRGTTSVTSAEMAARASVFSSADQTEARKSLRQFVISFTMAKEPGTSIAAPRDNEAVENSPMSESG